MAIDEASVARAAGFAADEGTAQLTIVQGGDLRFERTWLAEPADVFAVQEAVASVLFGMAEDHRLAVDGRQPGLAIRSEHLAPCSADEGVELAGKRVAVIGTGATGVQVIGAIADRVAHQSVSQRRPNWCAPLHIAPIAEAEEAVIRARQQEVPTGHDRRSSRRRASTRTTIGQPWPAIWVSSGSANSISDRAISHSMAAVSDADERSGTETTRICPNAWARPSRRRYVAPNSELVTSGL